VVNQVCRSHVESCGSLDICRHGSFIMCTVLCVVEFSFFVSDKYVLCPSASTFGVDEGTMDIACKKLF